MLRTFLAGSFLVLSLLFFGLPSGLAASEGDEIVQVLEGLKVEDIVSLEVVPLKKASSFGGFSFASIDLSQLNLFSFDQLFRVSATDGLVLEPIDDGWNGELAWFVDVCDAGIREINSGEFSHKIVAIHRH